jgi:tRNA nucleotidyltransferase (CCA-adding enzyme)
MTDTINTIISKAMQCCQPSRSDIEKLTTVADKTKNLVTKYTSPHIVEIVFGGSFAKGTWLKEDTDVDIFVKLDTSISDDEFELLGKQIGLESLKRYNTHLRYSDHPYVEAFVKGIRVNIVPCYNVEKGKWKSAADRSPFHTEYIKNNLDEEKRKQVRLLKKFLKSVGVYGAEIATSGFSGYVTEILILKYGSFESVLQAISNISSREGEKNVISIDKIDVDIIKTFQSQLIIVDPVDHRRNLGAAISAESIGKFLLAARAFLEKPSLKFLEKKDKKHINFHNQRLYSNLLIIEFSYSERSPDVIWGQLKRSLNAVSKQLNLAGFKVIRDTYITDEKKLAAFVFLLESDMLSSYAERIGPEIFRKDATTNFISKNSKESLLMWVDKEMKVKSLVERRAKSARDYIKLFLCERIESTGIAKGLISDVRSTLQIYTADERKIKGIVNDAVTEIVTTDSNVF